MSPVFAVLFAGTVLSAAALHNSGSNSTLLTSKIHGGEEAFKSEVVYINQNGQLKGGGSLIQCLIVLTAAHCVYESESISYNNLEVVYDDKAYKIRSGIIHPHFDSETKPYYVADIAILLLQEHPDVDPDYTVTMPCLRLSPEFMSSDSIAHVYGWGPFEAYDQSGLATHLRRLEVTIISNDECRKRFGSDEIQDFHMCAISPYGSFAPVEAGGPLIEHYDITDGEPIKKAIGVATFSDGQPNSPSVYTRISYYHKFIDDNMMTFMRKGNFIAAHGHNLPQSFVANPNRFISGSSSGNPVCDSIDRNPKPESNRIFKNLCKCFQKPPKVKRN